MKSVVVLALLGVSALADLPVHCGLDDLAGAWKITYSDVNNPNLIQLGSGGIPSGKMCSYYNAGSRTENLDFLRGQPSGASTSISSSDFPNMMTIALTKAQLIDPTPSGVGPSKNPKALVVMDDSLKPAGFWTSVFDEGIELRLGDRSMFAVSRYTCKPEYAPEKYGSSDSPCMSNDHAQESPDGSLAYWDAHCGETFMGVYHDTDPKTGKLLGFGCWYGSKDAASEEKFKESVEAPVEVSFTEETSKSLVKSRRGSRKDSSQGLTSACDLEDDIVTPFSDANSDYPQLAMRMPSKLPKNFNFEDVAKQYGFYREPRIQGSCGSCYVVSSISATEYKVNYLLAKLREATGEQFVATAMHPEGPSGAIAASSSIELHSHLHSGSRAHEARGHSSRGNSVEADNFIGPVSLSTEAPLVCNMYNQGCNGGLEMLVHRHSAEFGIPLESCFDSKESLHGVVSKCPYEKCYGDASKLVFVKDYGYVGGFHGTCSERAIKEELINNGPVTVAVNSAGYFGLMNFRFDTGKPKPSEGDTDRVALKFSSASGKIKDFAARANELFPELFEANVKPSFSRSRPNTVAVLVASAGKLAKLGGVRGVAARLEEIASQPKGASSFVENGVRAVSDSIHSGATVSRDDPAGSATAVDASTADVTLLGATAIGIHSWEFIDHSIMLVGWGEDSEGKYWLIRNSWNVDGTGKGQLTKISRGGNFGAVETGSVWVVPDMCKGYPRAYANANGFGHKLDHICSQ